MTLVKAQDEAVDRLQELVVHRRWEGLLALLERATAYWPALLEERMCAAWLGRAVLEVEGRERAVALELLRRRCVITGLLLCLFVVGP